MQFVYEFVAGHSQNAAAKCRKADQAVIRDHLDGVVFTYIVGKLLGTVYFDEKVIVQDWLKKLNG